MTELGLSPGLLAPLDAWRRELLRRARPYLGGLLSQREPRVACAGALTIGASLLLVVVTPLWVLALSPVVLGVPHLLADVRYLVVRPGLHRRLLLSIAVGLPLLAVSIWGDVAVGFLGVAAAGVLARAGLRRRLVVVTVALGAGAACWRAGPWAGVVLAHLHNCAAVLLWWLWRRRSSALHWIPLGLFALGAAAILVLPVERLALTGLMAPGGLDLATHEEVLAPGLGATAVRLTLCFAFAQSVHYGVWLRWIPDEARPGPAVRSFQASFRALRREMGTPALLGFGVLSAAIALWAMIDLAAARWGYFRLAFFHGHLEWAALALAWAERRRFNPC